MGKIKSSHHTAAGHGNIARSQLAPFLSDHRIKLLDAIHQHGSLSAAARALPMSYKAAWDALDAMNNLADRPLVVKHSGGKQGGGTSLTRYALRLVALYKALDQEYQQAYQQLEPKLHAPLSEDDLHVAQYRQLLRRMSVRSSARNQLAGTVVAISLGAVNSLVKVEVSEGVIIVAMISCESLSPLSIAVGSQVLCLIKASHMMVQPPNQHQLFTNNQLLAKVARITKGAVCDDISMTIAGQKTLAAVVPCETVASLALAESSQVTVSFSASSVIVCCY
ncbi:TOBE domain-containing protein [Agarivorans sp. MS3-6]